MTDFIILRDSSRPARAGDGALTEGLTLPGLGPRAASRALPNPRVEVADLSPGDLADVRRDPTVEAIARSMPTRLIEPMGEGADASAEGRAATWGVEATGAADATETGDGVRVAVLDTGIDSGHPAFAGMTLNERDFTGSGNGDVQGHGTHCAGTVFGRDVDGLRIGVAPGVQTALIGKVLGNDGSGRSEWLFDAMQWAMETEAQVISMSLGFDFPGLVERLIADGVPPLLATSIGLEGYRMNLRVFDRLMDLMEARAAFSGGAIVCAASGNESRRDEDARFEVSASLPAAALGVISVGALQQGASGLTVADFSNTNPILAAPGVDVISAKVGGGLRSLNGTSMATPHVAGLTALWWERARLVGGIATADAVQARMRTACVTDPLASGVDVAARGEGLAQAPSALASG